MQIFETVSEMQAWSSDAHQNGQSLGFVPTQGCLHQGHTHLLDRARHENSAVGLSVFVNPLQFRRDAFEIYPRRAEQDIEIARAYGVDAVFMPKTEEMYPQFDSLDGLFELQNEPSGRRNPDQFTVSSVGTNQRMNYVRVPESLVMRMDGADHPWHFDGVATVVRRLFEIVSPCRAYFGQKDIQQLAILKSMNQWMGTAIKIVSVPVVRDQNGLSLSSRLTMLDESQSLIAIQIAEYVKLASTDCLGGDAHKLLVELVANVENIQSESNTLVVDSVGCVDPLSLNPLGIITLPAVLFIAYLIDGIRLVETQECC